VRFFWPKFAIIKAVKPLALIVDDEKSLCSMLTVFFERRGFQTAVAHSRKEAESLTPSLHPEIALVDLSLGRDSGLDVLNGLLTTFPGMPVLVMTAYGTVEKAVEAIKLGAFDFLSKPFDMVYLAQVVDKALSQRALRRENQALREVIRRGQVEFIGQSPPIEDLRQRLRSAAQSDSTVLITGESGTGKEVVAKLLHQESRRNEGPFVVVNCSALSENLLESELFGHVKGSFTSAHADKEGLICAADQGTLFLDEIGDMPLKTQVKLLRVLQERDVTPVGGTVSRKVDVRFLAATNVIMEEAVARGRFREDLYYRLNVLRLNTPALRERGDDALLLAGFFLEKKSKGRKRFSTEALHAIGLAPWPGNVRQLENAVERAIAFSAGSVIELEDWNTSEAGMASVPRSDSRSESRLDSSSPPVVSGNQNALTATPGLEPTLAVLEKAYIHWVLSENQWQKPKAAKILGLDISTLYRKIERYGLKPEP
jgi:DNA-binding NtrC family response regulator